MDGYFSDNVVVEQELVQMDIWPNQLRFPRVGAQGADSSMATAAARADFPVAPSLL